MAWRRWNLNISDRILKADAACAYRGVHVFVVTIMRERDVSHTQPMQQTQCTETRSDLVQSFYPDQAGNATRLKDLPHFARASRECQMMRISFNQSVYQVDLLQSISENAKSGRFAIVFRTVSTLACWALSLSSATA